MQENQSTRIKEIENFYLPLPSAIINKDKTEFIVIDGINNDLLISGIYKFDNQAMILRKYAAYKALDFIKYFPNIGSVVIDRNNVNLKFINQLGINLVKDDDEDKNNVVVLYKVLNNELNDNNISISKLYYEVKDDEKKVFNFKSELQTKKEFKKLKVYSILGYDSILLTIVSNIQKILYITLLDNNTGLCANNNIDSHDKFCRIQEIWPELDCEFISNGKNCQFNVNILKNNQTGFYKITRSFFNNDVYVELIYDDCI